MHEGSEVFKKVNAAYDDVNSYTEMNFNAQMIDKHIKNFHFEKFLDEIEKLYGSTEFKSFLEAFLGIPRTIWKHLDSNEVNQFVKISLAAGYEKIDWIFDHFLKRNQKLLE